MFIQQMAAMGVSYQLHNAAFASFLKMASCIRKDYVLVESEH